MGERFVYIHGFNSGPNSRSARLIEQLAGSPVLRVDYDYARPMPECAARLVAQINATGAGRVCLIGSSLGGFYALLLAARCPAVARVVAFNPAVYPAVQLAQFLGRNVRLGTELEWIFTREALVSYAKAGDPRADGFAGPRDIVLGRKDEVLDFGVTAAYWEGHARLAFSDDAHQIADYAPFAAILLGTAARKSR